MTVGNRGRRRGLRAPPFRAAVEPAVQDAGRRLHDEGSRDRVDVAAGRRRAAALADLLHWVDGRLHEPLTVPDLARRANMSTRNLTRRFTATTGVTPLRRLRTRRIHRARELLETTDDSVELIAARTGMGTAATLRRHFHRALGVPPDTYRRTLRTGGTTGRNSVL